VRPLTLAQSQALLDAVAGHRLALLYHLALLLGLRKGELLGLRWDDFDPTGGTLKITGQVQTIGGKTERSNSPKSEASRRVLPLPITTVALVQALRTAQQEESERLGAALLVQGLMFPSEAGTPIIPRNLSRHWYGLLQAVQLPTQPFHILRHTAATRLDEVGASEAVKAAVLGHGPRSVTGGYVHASPEEMRTAIERVEERLLKRGI
jgi:integrase